MLTQTVKPDYIIINIPLDYNNYPNDFIIPPFLYTEGVIINRCIDYGPATKLLGLSTNEIFQKMSDDSFIIVIDDDRIYDSTLIEHLLKNNKVYPDKILTTIGFTLNEISNNAFPLVNTKSTKIEFNEDGSIKDEYLEGRYVDMLAGCGGFLLTKQLFPFHTMDMFELDPKDDKYYDDDVWFSGFITVHKRDIYMVPIAYCQDPSKSINNDISPLSGHDRVKRSMAGIRYFIEKYKIWIK